MHSICKFISAGITLLIATFVLIQDPVQRYKMDLIFTSL